MKTWHLPRCSDFKACSQYAETLSGANGWSLKSYYRRESWLLGLALVAVPLLVYGLCRGAAVLTMWVWRGFSALRAIAKQKALPAGRNEGVQAWSRKEPRPIAQAWMFSADSLSVYLTRNSISRHTSLTPVGQSQRSSLKRVSTSEMNELQPQNHL